MSRCFDIIANLSGFPAIVQPRRARMDEGHSDLRRIDDLDELLGLPRLTVFAIAGGYLLGCSSKCNDPSEEARSLLGVGNIMAISRQSFSCINCSASSVLRRTLRCFQSIEPLSASIFALAKWTDIEIIHYGCDQISIRSRSELRRVQKLSFAFCAVFGNSWLLYRNQR